MTTLAIQSRYWTSLMSLASKSFFTSSSIACCRSGAKFLFFYLTGLTDGSTWRWWVITFIGMLGMSAGDQAKTSALSLRKLMSFALVTWSRRLPIWTVFVGSSSLNGIEIVRSTGSPWPFSSSRGSSCSKVKESFDWRSCMRRHYLSIFELLSICRFHSLLGILPWSGKLMERHEICL